MRPTLVQGGACLLALLATVIATPAEARGACNRFEGYLSSYSRELEAGDRDRLVFIDRRESRTAYRVCIGPSGSRPKCLIRKTAQEPGETSNTVVFRAGEPGRYLAQWYVAGRRKARLTFRVVRRRPAVPGLPPVIEIEGAPPPPPGCLEPPRPISIAVPPPPMDVGSPATTIQ